MARVEIYDKPMCCSTGICGPEVDPVLPRFAADLDWLESAGHVVERYNLAQQPSVFAENVTVREFLETESVDRLPLVMVDGQIVSRATYPSREQLAAWVAGKTISSTTENSSLPVLGSADDCCGDSDCC